MDNLYLDCEFDGFGGELISLALVDEWGKHFYAVDIQYFVGDKQPRDKWVADNVVPILTAPVFMNAFSVNSEFPALRLPLLLGHFLSQYKQPNIIADWPDDISYFCKAMITGPGEMIKTGDLNFEVKRVDAYPTALKGCVQHNAYWDAMALRCKLAPETFNYEDCHV